MTKPLLDEKRQRIKNKIDKAIDDLPVLPSAVAQLMSLSTSDENYFEKVKEIAEKDPTFTARLIKVANSVANSPIHQITTISQAIARIGSRQIKSLISTFAIAKIFTPSNQSELNLWVHSIQVAVASHTIAQISSAREVDPEQAYLCGLVHDIGRFVLFSVIPNGPVRVDERDWDTPEQLLNVEKDVCGATHANLGGYAVKRWGLPSQIANVITNHHEYHYLSSTAQEVKETHLIQIIQIADHLSVLMMRDPDVLTLPPAELEKLIEDKCFHSSWDKPLVSSFLLQKEAQNIHQTASKIISGLEIKID